jgi:hypothetical protein
MRDSDLFKYNTLITTVGFFCVRILVIPFAWFHFYQMREEMFQLTNNVYLYHATIMLLILSDLQNIDWCKRLYASTLKSFSKKKTS